MTAADRESYHKQLMALRQRLNGDVSDLSDEAFRDNSPDGGALSRVPIHMADMGTDANEQENTLDLLAREEKLLDEITAALGRFDKGTFGVCEGFGGAIARARLKELPYTRF